MRVINKLESYPTGDMLVPYCPNCDNPTYSEKKCPFCNTELEYEEMIEKDKEIERQKEVINGMIENEEKYLLEINKLKSIIKEVREYIENNWISQKDADNYRFDDEELDIEISDIAVLYDILDKERNNVRTTNKTIL